MVFHDHDAQKLGVPMSLNNFFVCISSQWRSSNGVSVTVNNDNAWIKLLIVKWICSFSAQKPAFVVMARTNLRIGALLKTSSWSQLCTADGTRKVFGRISVYRYNVGILLSVVSTAV